MQCDESKLLAPYTTFGIGGPARWFAEAHSEDEIVEATHWAASRDIPLFVLGGGSNLLVSDAGFNGLVLHIALRGIEADKGFYRVAAGEDWDHFVERTVQDNCAGLECLAGIPGTVGGTPVQNVGAYGQEVATTIERVRAFDLKQREFIEFTASECHFAYRHSRFNSADKGRYIVTRVNYRLTPNGAPTIRYGDLSRALGEGATASLTQTTATVRSIRQSKGMLMVDGDPDCHSAGSFFKNPVVSQELFEKIAASSSTPPPSFPAGTGAENHGKVKIPAAWLIEQAGFPKGYALGRAGVSSRHTLALINRGEASANEILALARQIVSTIEAQFGIVLVMEPVMVGF